jgi:aspartokinase-like uncharacterized kinase
MAKKLSSYPKFRELEKKLQDQLTKMMALECMECKARLHQEILETVSDIIIFVKEEDH